MINIENLPGKFPEHSGLLTGVEKWDQAVTMNFIGSVTLAGYSQKRKKLIDIGVRYGLQRIWKSGFGRFPVFTGSGYWMLRG